MRPPSALPLIARATRTYQAANQVLAREAARRFRSAAIDATDTVVRAWCSDGAAFGAATTEVTNVAALTPAARTALVEAQQSIAGRVALNQVALESLPQVVEAHTSVLNEVQSLLRNGQLASQVETSMGATTTIVEDLARAAQSLQGEVNALREAEAALRTRQAILTSPQAVTRILAEGETAWQAGRIDEWAMRITSNFVAERAAEESLTIARTRFVARLGAGAVGLASVVFDVVLLSELFGGDENLSEREARPLLERAIREHLAGLSRTLSPDELQRLRTETADGAVWTRLEVVIRPAHWIGDSIRVPASLVETVPMGLTSQHDPNDLTPPTRGGIVVCVPLNEAASLIDHHPDATDRHSSLNDSPQTPAILDQPGGLPQTAQLHPGHEEEPDVQELGRLQMEDQHEPEVMKAEALDMTISLDEAEGDGRGADVSNVRADMTFSPDEVLEASPTIPLSLPDADMTITLDDIQDAAAEVIEDHDPEGGNAPDADITISIDEVDASTSNSQADMTISIDEVNRPDSTHPTSSPHDSNDSEKGDAGDKSVANNHDGTTSDRIGGVPEHGEPPGGHEHDAGHGLGERHDEQQEQAEEDLEPLPEPPDEHVRPLN